MEETSVRDEAAGAEARDSSEDSTASQTPGKDLTSTAEEAAFVTGSESAPPRKTPLIRWADSLDQDTFKICKELFRPYKKSLRNLHFQQPLSTEKKMKQVKESLTIIGDHINLFLQQHCRSSEVKPWQKMLWQFVSLFSEKDAKELQKLYKYIKNNQVHKFKQLCCPSEEPDSVPGLEEEKSKQASISRSSYIQEHLDQSDSHHQHTHKVTTQQQA